MLTAVVCEAVPVVATCKLVSSVWRGIAAMVRGGSVLLLLLFSASLPRGGAKTVFPDVGGGGSKAFPLVRG